MESKTFFDKSLGIKENIYTKRNDIRLISAVSRLGQAIYKVIPPYSKDEAITLLTRSTNGFEVNQMKEELLRDTLLLARVIIYVYMS